MSTQVTDLRTLILEANELLDPQHQGLQWPAPIEYDGRPLDEIARDLTVVLDAPIECGEQPDDRRVALSAALWAAANA